MQIVQTPGGQKIQFILIKVASQEVKNQKIVSQREVLPPGRYNYYQSWCMQFLGILRWKY